MQEWIPSPGGRTPRNKSRVSHTTTRTDPIYGEMFVGSVMALNAFMVVLLFYRGLPFMGSPTSVDMPTAVICIATAIVATIWAGAFANGVR